MTSPRDRLEAEVQIAERYRERTGRSSLCMVHAGDLKALLSERRVGREALAGLIAADPAYLAEVRDEQQTWLALHLADRALSLLNGED